MDQFELVAPCHFGLEAVLKREIQDLGYEILQVEDGKVTFKGDQAAIARANIFLRTPERIMIKAGEFKAYTFDELFENIKAIPWEKYFTKDARFWVTKATSVKSKLFSVSDIQSIAKKAMVEHMKKVYKTAWFPETGAEYPVRITALKDRFTVCIDTTGDSLHKRGYRKIVSHAPVTETLAAALLMLTPWKEDRILVDPFCGSGTFPIEAAMIGANIAPGMNREFTAENWTNILPKKDWYAAMDEADSLIKTDVEMNIQGYDIDDEMVKAARQNAREAGVDHLIHFQQREVADLRNPKKYGFVITNPPYGERLENKETLPILYQQMADSFALMDTWSFYILTAYEEVEKFMHRKATKNRKIYNGMMKTRFYSFLGPKPPRKK